VVASLWPLRDDDAVRFFGVFYDHLDRGKTVAAALTSTRQALHAAGHPPRAWAGIVAIGDGRLRLPERERAADTRPDWRREYGGAVLLGVALFAGTMAVRRRSKKASAR